MSPSVITITKYLILLSTPAPLLQHSKTNCRPCLLFPSGHWRPPQLQPSLCIQYPYCWVTSTIHSFHVDLLHSLTGRSHFTFLSVIGCCMDFCVTIATYPPICPIPLSIFLPHCLSRCFDVLYHNSLLSASQ